MSAELSDAGCRRLAVAVLHFAVKEAKKRTPDGDDAALFLKGGPELEFWCELAGLDARAIGQRMSQTSGTNKTLYTNYTTKKPMPKKGGGKKGC